jgi:hypothetical protein
MSEGPKLSHAELVLRAARWLRNQQRCALVVTEPAGQNLEEMPDAIGWRLHGRGSVLIECKTTIGDYHADNRKVFREHPILGMGRERYYMTEPGVLPTEQWWRIRDGWGHLIVRGRNVEIAQPAIPFDASNAALAEQRLMIALVRRREGIMPSCQLFAEPIEPQESEVA